jgi:micrococcal nuclease
VRTWIAALAIGALALGACAGSGDDGTAEEDTSGRSYQRASPGEPEESPATGTGDKHAEQDASAPDTQSPRPVRRYAVVDVVDGDTVEVAHRGGVTVRVIGIDTPETVAPGEPVECGGPAASATAETLLSGRRVRLVFDPTQGRTDTYGRTLAYLRVPNVGDFGLAMIERGRAAEYTYDAAYQRQAIYRAAETRARQAGRGLWGGCGGIDVPLYPPTQPDEPQSVGGNCQAGYDPCVPPYPPDVDCDDLDGPIRVTGDDPHGLDRNGNGAGCEY